jgi:hypothetical protein
MTPSSMSRFAVWCGGDRGGCDLEWLEHTIGDHTGDQDLPLGIDVGDRLSRLVNGEFFRGRDEEQAADLGIGECVLESRRLLTNGACRYESGDGLGRCEVGLKLTERGSVGDDEIPFSAQDFEDRFSNRDDLPDSRGGVGQDAEGAGELSHRKRAGNVELEAEILLEGVRPINGRTEQSRTDACRFVGEGVDAEVGGESAGLDHRDRKDALPATSSEDGKGRRDRRLADTTLAGDDEKPSFEHALRVAGAFVGTRTEDRHSGTLRPQTKRRFDGPVECRRVPFPVSGPGEGREGTGDPADRG